MRIFHQSNFVCVSCSSIIIFIFSLRYARHQPVACNLAQNRYVQFNRESGQLKWPYICNVNSIRLFTLHSFVDLSVECVRFGLCFCLLVYDTNQLPLLVYCVVFFWHRTHSPVLFDVMRVFLQSIPLIVCFSAFYEHDSVRAESRICRSNGHLTQRSIRRSKFDSKQNKTKNRQNINAVTFCGNLILLTIQMFLPPSFAHIQYVCVRLMNIVIKSLCNTGCTQTNTFTPQ